jgi:chromosome partitioning protein
MGTVIAIASQKGGVGKTTTTLNLGFSLSRLGGKVLLIDGDPQGGLSFASNVKKRARGTLVDVLRGRIAPSDAVTFARDGQIGVVAMGCSEASDVDLVERTASSGVFAKLITEFAQGFDYAFIDAPGGLGTFSRSLLAACDGVVGVLTCDALSMRSLPGLLKALQSLTGDGTGPRLEGLLATMIDPRRVQDRDLLQRLRSALPQGALFETVIPFDDSFEQASLSSVPVALLPSAAEAARSYMALAVEFRTRLGRGRGESDGDLGLF